MSHRSIALLSRAKPAADRSSGRRATRTAPQIVVSILTSIVILAPPLRAQGTVSGEFAVLSANAVIGGLTSGLVSWFRGESFTEAFGGGAAGGAVQYLGKRISASDFTGAGLAGRMVAATGTSMARNGAAGRGLLDLIVLPVGPVTLYWTTASDSGQLVPKLHLGRTIFLARLIADPGLSLDWRQTLSAGAPVFVAEGRIIRGQNGSPLGGLELWGTISVSDVSLLPPIDADRLLAHERVHIGQDDFLTIGWADPVEDWIVEGIPGGDVVNRYVDLGLVYMAMGGLLIFSLPYEERPWEVEAEYLGAGW